MKGLFNSKWIAFILVIPLVVLLMFSCKDDDKVPTDPVINTTPYELKLPHYFPPMQIPPDNPLTVEGVELGRHLYYDKELSKNGPLEGSACASCHRQSSSFTSNLNGTAIMAHVNLGWSSKFLWFGGVEGELEDIMKFELEEFFQVDLNLLKSKEIYRTLFKQAFGSEDITMERATKAMAQFFRSLTSTNSAYDRYLRYGISLSPSALKGYEIFFTEKGDCFHCHSDYMFMDDNFHNIGLDSVFEGQNKGRFNVTGSGFDYGKFKTPTLRNIELTYPYMHDGRFETLEEVVSFYNTGVNNSATLDPIMTKPGKENGLNLTQQDIADVVAFLKTLTDTSYVHDPDHGDPW